MRLILHIGTPKAGSTSIQVMLASNRDFLAARGILYPAIGCAAHQHALCGALFTPENPKRARNWLSRVLS